MSVCLSVLLLHDCGSPCSPHIFRRSLNLIDTLLNLAEQGHYNEVKALFGVPVKQCTDVLFIGLLQCKVRHSTVVKLNVLIAVHV